MSCQNPFPMNPEIKAKWVAELRSGNYTQGVGFLHNVTDNTFCCLGVLGDVMHKCYPSKYAYDKYGELNVQIEGNVVDKEDLVLPSELMKDVVLDEPDPVVLVDKEQELYMTLSSLNDNGYSFSKIANLIEEQL